MTDLPSIPELLDLETIEPDLYRSGAVYDAPWGMFGGQAAAQALYAAGPYESERIITGPSLDHAVWFHRPATMNGWTWQEMTPRTVAGGRGWYTAAIYTPEGTRIASVAQEQLFASPRNR